MLSMFPPIEMERTLLLDRKKLQILELLLPNHGLHSPTVLFKPGCDEVSTNGDCVGSTGFGW